MLPAGWQPCMSRHWREKFHDFRPRAAGGCESPRLLRSHQVKPVANERRSPDRAPEPAQRGSDLPRTSLIPTSGSGSVPLSGKSFATPQGRARRRRPDSTCSRFAVSPGPAPPRARNPESPRAADLQVGCTPVRHCPACDEDVGVQPAGRSREPAVAASPAPVTSSSGSDRPRAQGAPPSAQS